MMTFHGDIFDCLGQGCAVRIIILCFFFLDSPRCAWSALSRLWADIFLVELSHLDNKTYIPSLYTHMPGICLSVNHCVCVNVSLALPTLQMNLSIFFGLVL